MRQEIHKNIPADEYAQTGISSLVQDVIGAYTQTGENTDVLGSYTGNMRVAPAERRYGDEVPVQDADDL